MDSLYLARIAHLASVIAWFGGVWFVTLIVIPAIGSNQPPDRRMEAFHQIEGRFAPQASAWVLLTGASGFWMAWKMGLWWRFADWAYWWMWAMLALWLLFVVMLFIIEPFVIHPRMKRRDDDGRSFGRMQLIHWILSLAGLITIAGAVAGAHGWTP